MNPEDLENNVNETSNTPSFTVSTTAKETH